MSEWQPIETAPKDGTEILIWDGICRTTASWDARPPAYWRLVSAGDYSEDDQVNPTHWMPLPEPPKVEKSTAEVQS